MGMYLYIFEGILISFLVYRLFKLVSNYKKLEKELTFLEKVQSVLEGSMPKPVRMIVFRELAMIYYLFARNKKEEGLTFSYHKAAGYKGILVALLSVILMESIGLYFLFHQWSPIVSWIHIGLNIYGVLYLISDYRAIVQLPIVVRDGEIHIKIGTRREMKVPINQIASIKGGQSFHENKKLKDVFKGVLMEFDTPQFEILLKEPIMTVNFLGRLQEIRTIYLTVDDKENFQRYVVEKMECRQATS
jgi:hypothetical protein